MWMCGAMGLREKKGSNIKHVSPHLRQVVPYERSHKHNKIGKP